MEESVWILQFFGRLHPLVVHFPIGLLVVALFLEFLTINGKRPGLREGIIWMVNLGAVLAILSTLFGWSLHEFDDYSGDLVSLHQNWGIATAVLSLISALLLRATLKGQISNFLPYRSTLIVSVVALTIAGHLGASLTHGEDFLTGVLPGSQTNYDDSKTMALLTKFNQQDSLEESQLDDLNLEVRAILAHNCYQCHSENKQKGDLVLENKRGVFKGGESGPIIVAGKPEESELYRRITLSPNDDKVMPKKGKVLKESEIALVRLWIEKGAHWSDRPMKVFAEAELSLTKPELPQSSKENHPIDKLVDAYFEKNDVKWPEVVDDRTFIRRTYLDIIGLLPEPSAIDLFINDNNPEKRAELIDQLLDDNHNYTQHWLSFWNDLLRNDYSGTGFITGGRKQITGWLYQSLLDNKPYDQMVKELVNPTPESEGFIKGIKWRGVVNASQRTEMQAAQNIGQSLMGVNLKCASCHNSFISNLTLEQAYGFATVFADTVLELNRCDKPIGKMATVNFIYPELGSVEADNVKDRLAKLSEVMIKPENGRLYRTITNRIWQRLLGRGMIEPVDEMDNLPWDNDLLDWLAADFIDSGHDLKQLIRLIMTSKAYQLPAVNYEKIEEIKAKDFVFEGPVIRRISAEQFSDAVSQIVSPVFYAAAFDPNQQKLSSSRIWHREIKFDRDVLPEPGERYFRYQFPLPEKEIEQAQVLISVDHSYALYINEKKISEGADWRKVDKTDVTKTLVNGENIIALAGSNEGEIANPAGILFALKIIFKDGEETIIYSNREWKSTADKPSEGWMSLDYDDDEDWKKVRNFGSRHWDKLLSFSFDENSQSFARASLVRQHPFMKALGRPTRENVATSRDEQATLLQALELTNGEYFNQVLEEGAKTWIDTFGANSGEIPRELYQNALGREPSNRELKIMQNALGDSPGIEEIQDLFWVTLLSPEFQFIY